MGVEAPQGRPSTPASVALGDLVQVDLVERGADDLRLVGLGVAAPLQLLDQLLQALDVLVVERDADDLVVRRLGLLLLWAQHVSRRYSLGSTDVPFIFEEPTADYQTVTLQGQVSYRVVETTTPLDE